MPIELVRKHVNECNADAVINFIEPHRLEEGNFFSTGVFLYANKWLKTALTRWENLSNVKAAITTSFGLNNYRFIIHAIGVDPELTKSACEDLKGTIQIAFTLIKKYGLHSVVIPVPSVSSQRQSDYMIRLLNAEVEQFLMSLGNESESASFSFLFLEEELWQLPDMNFKHTSQRDDDFWTEGKESGNSLSQIPTEKINLHPSIETSCKFASEGKSTKPLAETQNKDINNSLPVCEDSLVSPEISSEAEQAKVEQLLKENLDSQEKVLPDQKFLQRRKMPDYYLAIENYKKMADGQTVKTGSKIYTNKGYFIECKECGKEFFVSYEEREKLISKSLLPPKRCKKCREKRRKNPEERDKYYGAIGTMFRDGVQRPKTARQQAYEHFIPEDLL